MKKNVSVLTVLLVSFSLSLMFGGKSDEFKIISENGVPVALNPGHPIPEKNSPKDIAFTEELTIGKPEEDPNYIFGELISYTVDGEGNIYVLDMRMKAVRKYDARGVYQMTIGREGQGPDFGNFRHP